MRHASVPASLATQVYGVIRRRILRGDLVIGDAISRRKIAADLRTSLLPVSEALLRLECEGLLEHRPRAGTRVRVPSAADVKGHYIVREALEVEAAVRFTQVATVRERADLRALAVRVDALASQPDRHVYDAVHRKLHVWIAECSRCAALREEIEKTCAMVSIWIGIFPEASAEDSFTRHQELVDRVISGVPSAAAHAVRQHIAVDVRQVLDLLEPYLRQRGVHRHTFARSRT